MARSPQNDLIPFDPDWPTWTRAYLRVFAERGNHSAACRAAGVSRNTPYNFRQSHPDFAAACQDAEALATERLEDEAWRRAHDGIDRPLIHKGEVVWAWYDPDGHLVEPDTPGAKRRPVMDREFSNTLLMRLLEARSAKYRRTAAVEMSGPNGGPMEHKHEHAFGTDSLAEIGRILADCGALPPGPGEGAHAPAQ